MSDLVPMLAPFGALIGAWPAEATHPAADVIVPGTVSFKWAR